MPEHKVEQTIVGDLHTLGTSGRARCVDNIGQVVDCYCRGRFGYALLRQQRCVAVQADDLGFLSAESCSQALLCDQHGGLGILQHEGEALRWVGGIKRYVGTTRLEDTQQPHHHVQGALYAQTHEHIGSHTQRLQVVGELVGTLD